MYELLDVPASSDALGCWARHLGSFSEVVGYSHFGAIFLRDPRTSEYRVLYPLASGTPLKDYGRFETRQAFETRVLKDPTFVDYALRPADLNEVRSRVGALNMGEVYYPVPYPCLGGSGALATYSKGNLWVFMDIVGQTLGLDEDFSGP